MAMRMNVQPIPTLDERVNEIRQLTASIVNKEILPNENFLWIWRRAGRFSDNDVKQAHELRENIKAKVKEAGLWAPHLPPEYGGAGLDFLEHAYMNEVLAYAVGAAALFGVVAPNSGNQTILVKYGTEEQKKKWLVPMIEGDMQSGFSMTEPDAPGSDPAYAAAEEGYAEDTRAIPRQRPELAEERRRPRDLGDGNDQPL